MLQRAPFADIDDDNDVAIIYSDARAHAEDGARPPGWRALAARIDDAPLFSPCAAAFCRATSSPAAAAFEKACMQRQILTPPSSSFSDVAAAAAAAAAVCRRRHAMLFFCE